MIIFSLFVLTICSSNNSDNSRDGIPMDNEIYFPPINSDVWQTASITNLGWNENQLQSLLDYLEEKNTNGFRILTNGKIVVENYVMDTVQQHHTIELVL